MASNVSEEETFQCSKCVEFLDLASKTLPCLHSFCGSCVKMILEGNGLCPQCQKRVTNEELRLAPFLVKSFKRRQLESRQLNCDTCSEDGKESSGQIWCQDCQKLLCQTCECVHLKHETKDLSGVSRVEAIRVITMEDCRRHRQSKDAFCNRCNVCMCDACYKEHVTASPQCPSRPLSVREEALKGKEEGGPTLGRELRQFEIHIRATYGQTDRSIELLRAELSARLHQSFAAPEKIRWVVTFPKWCHDSLESLKKEIIVWTTQTSGHLQLESECRLQGSNPLRWISSIVASEEDNHVFVGDWNGGSILEFRDSGELVGQFPLKDGGETFYPRDMCRLPEDILVVCCPWGSGWGGKSFLCGATKIAAIFKKAKNNRHKRKEIFFFMSDSEKNFRL